MDRQTKICQPFIALAFLNTDNPCTSSPGGGGKLMLEILLKTKLGQNQGCNVAF